MSSMYVFMPSCGSLICHVLLTAKHNDSLDFYSTKTKQYLQTKTLVSYWALKKRQALLTIWAKLKLAINFSVYFSVAKTGEIFASLWQEEEDFEVLKR